MNVFDGQINLCPFNDCGYVCCQFDQGNYILLYPGEIERAVVNGKGVGHLELVEEFHGGFKAVCRAHDASTCDGGYKPLDCASYPVFPVLDEGEIRMGIRGSKCPLPTGRIGQHVESMTMEWHRLAGMYPEIVPWLEHAEMVGYEAVDLEQYYAYPGRKLRKWSAEDDWRTRLVWARIGDIIPADEVQELEDRTLAWARQQLNGRSAAYGWSGGKDSIVVQHLAAQLGIHLGHQFLCQKELEFPALERFYDQHRPEGVILERSHQDWAWLLRDIRLLFPEDAAQSSRWNQPKWTAHRRFLDAHHCDAFLVGRRRIDGNMVGRDGIQEDRDGRLTINLIHDWDHEQVFAYLYHHQLPVPPYFTWPFAFKHGNDPWPKRSDFSSERENWHVLFSIDSSVVAWAAGDYPEAAAVLRERDYFQQGGYVR